MIRKIKLVIPGSRGLLARRNYFKLFSILILFFKIPVSSSAQTGERVYQSYCAGCHGAQLQGSVASPLIKKTWKYGGDRSSILKVIRNGIPETTMVSWEGTLSLKEIEAVTDYIIRAQAKPVEKKETAKPLEISTKLYKLKIEKISTQGLTTPW